MGPWSYGPFLQIKKSSFWSNCPWEQWDYWKKSKQIVLGVLALGSNWAFLKNFNFHVILTHPNDGHWICSILLVNCFKFSQAVKSPVETNAIIWFMGFGVGWVKGLLAMHCHMFFAGSKKTPKFLPRQQQKLWPSELKCLFFLIWWSYGWVIAI